MVPVRGRRALALLSLALFPLSGEVSPAGAECIDYRDTLHRIATLGSPPGGVQLAVEGPRGVIALGAAGFAVLDLADPYEPAVSALVDTPGWARSADLLDERLYVCDGDFFRIYDVSDPYAPISSASVLAPACGGLLAAGNRLYVLVGAQLWLYDVTDPSAPSPISFLPLVGAFPRGLTRVGDSIFLACTSEVKGPLFIAVVDVSTPSQPTELLRFPLSDYTTTSFGIGIETNGVVLAAGGSSIVDYFDISDPMAPVSLGFGYCDGAALDLTADHLLNGCGATVALTALAALSPPALDGFLETGGYVADIAHSGAFGYVLQDGAAGVLDVLDLGAPDLPEELGVATTTGAARGLAVVDDRLYVADGNAGLRIFDLADPLAPSSLGGIDTPSFAHDVTLAPPYAFICDGASGCRVIDVSNPAAPQSVAALDTPGTAYGGALLGDHLLVADGDFGLQVLDVAIPTSLSTASSTPMSGKAYRVEVASEDDALACVVGGETVGFVQLVDVSDPESPVLLGSLSLARPARGVEISNGIAYIACLADLSGQGSIALVALADPMAPVLLRETRTPLSAYDVTVAEVVTFVSGGELDGSPSGRVWVYDFSRPDVGALLATLRTDDVGRAIEHSSEALYGAFDSDEVRSFATQCVSVSDAPDVPPSDRSVGLVAQPNPARGSVRFTLQPAQAEVEIEIHALDGRHVRTLVAATGSVDWDRRDQHGRRVAAGVYFVSGRTAKGTVSRSVVLID